MGEIASHRQLNNALVETPRPALYKPLKYWGKKPINIWKEFIECYCPENGVVLDPFAGSSIVAFEGSAIGRRVYSFDINPMSSFFIESLSSQASIDSIQKRLNEILIAVRSNQIYKKHYEINSEFLAANIDALDDEYGPYAANNNSITIYNYYWYRGRIEKVRVKSSGHNPVSLPDISSEKMSLDSFEYMDDISMDYWYPTDSFPNNPSINQSFIKAIGGNTFDKLWTRRNLCFLSMIFHFINESDEEVKPALMAGFVHALHLTTKMVYPRSDRSNRNYSGSWGRADYMIRDKQLEQNPLIVFERGMNDRNGVIKALKDYRERIGIEPSKMHYVSVHPIERISPRAVINYGNVDIADLLELVEPNTVDFVITDPPYGGLIQYMDLSLVWLVWLKKYKSRYKYDATGEITVKNGIVSRENYVAKLTRAFQNIHAVLKEDGYLVLTFHNQDIGEWNDFIRSLRQAGFIVDKITHQYNARSGEANVSNPYGTSGSDFYIRCVKHKDFDFTDTEQSLASFVVNKTIDIIAERCEPTPFEFIKNGILPEMIQAGYLEFDQPAEQIRDILEPYSEGNDAIFAVTQSDDRNLGDIWWFTDYRKYIKHPNLTLDRRVRDTVRAILRRQVSVKFDDVLAEIFREFPNGLTPDVRRIRDVLSDYADKSNGKWKLKSSVREGITRHTHAIENACTICRKLKLAAHIGVREQREISSNGKALREQRVHCDIPFETFGIADTISQDRINQIDLVAFDDRIRFAVEVESTTGFTSAINRCSNLDVGICKIMVIPDNRIDEFRRVCRDPQVAKDFKEQNWRYISFTGFERVASSKLKSMDDLIDATSELE